MLELTRGQTINGYSSICLKVPSDKEHQIVDLIEKVLELVGYPVRGSSTEDEELHSIEDIFPQSHGGTALRGLRKREGLTQKRLAEQINSKPSHISEMETGKRPIGKEMAKRLARALHTNYKTFL
jgi:ribosome-binding protein aMBF1 (putative translation factor)